MNNKENLFIIRTYTKAELAHLYNPTVCIKVALQILRRGGFSPPFSLLIPAFSLLIPPELLTLLLQRPTERSPTNCLRNSTASVHNLAPLHCRRRDSRPVSYYALFKGMAASKPTSWLFMNLHLLSHLVMIRDLSWWSGLFPF